MLQEHAVIDRHIDYPLVFIHLSFIAEYDGTMDVIKRSAQKVIECTMHSVILAGFDLQWQYRQLVIIINYKIG